MKKMILIGTILITSTLLHAESIQGAIADVTKEKINADKKVAMASITKGTEVTVSNTNIDIKTQVKNGAILGNTGLIAVGTKVELDDAEIKLDTNVDTGVLIGNSGILLGGK